MALSIVHILISRDSATVLPFVHCATSYELLLTSLPLDVFGLVVVLHVHMWLAVSVISYHRSVIS